MASCQDRWSLCRPRLPLSPSLSHGPSPTSPSSVLPVWVAAEVRGSPLTTSWTEASSRLQVTGSIWKEGWDKITSSTLYDNVGEEREVSDFSVTLESQMCNYCWDKSNECIQSELGFACGSYWNKENPHTCTHMQYVHWSVWVICWHWAAKGWVPFQRPFWWRSMLPVGFWMALVWQQLSLVSPGIRGRAAAVAEPNIWQKGRKVKVLSRRLLVETVVLRIM